MPGLECRYSQFSHRGRRLGVGQDYLRGQALENAEQTLSEYILERLSSRSDMVLVEFRIIMSFPNMFMYRTSVSTRNTEMSFIGEDQSDVD